MSESIIAVGFVVAMLVLTLVGLALMLFLFLGAPFLMKRRIAAWTTGMSAAQAYETIARGATRSFFQVRPASFMKEGQLTVPHPPHVVVGMLAHQFQQGFGRRVLGHDPSGVVVSRRWLPFLATDMGWVGALTVHPGGYGSVVNYRFRSTYMLPVITVFLQLYLELGLLGPMKRAVQAT